jgi:hypothetical protein
MTTIAANRVCIAADTRVTGDVITSVRKLIVLPHSIFGCAGDMEAIRLFVDWATAGFPQKRRPNFGESAFEALELDQTGIWVWERTLTRYVLEDDFHAIGSGAMAAKVAMYLGKTPAEAIEIASRFDEATGGKIHVEGLKKRG